ncbi:PQQ-like beta-propeller repeat protein [Metabacillus sp. KIGAM252]|uniref:PQQ-like beta-propeller repeat protein n=1 Tax=Metabacillus flavus TaxID=2823519 RepID=A0ABS5LGW4_9BACI|nr:PQQ-like beta-propeller repeat protein [Metabacillus flavus]MBS2969839.1 PQQ-like beta-propeller repeat protein [Metabacillus flavus]
MGEERFVVAAKGFFLIVNIKTGKTIQLQIENSEYPYVSFASSGGLFYSGAGQVFYCLDPFSGNFVFKGEVQDEAAVFAITEGWNGLIYFVSYPNLMVREFDPNQHQLRSLASLNIESGYAGTLASGKDGWMYAGIGTENPFIAAFHPESGKQTAIGQLTDGIGTGYVRKGNGGRVFAQYKSAALRSFDPSQPWLELGGGKVLRSIQKPLEGHEYWGEGFHTCHGQVAGKEKLVSFDLTEKKIRLTNQVIPVSYHTPGAELSTVTAGPDGKLYGTSMHPMRLFRADQNGMELIGSLEQGGGGNICTYAVLDQDTMFGSAYAGGKLYEFSLNKPFSANENPRLILKADAVHRPRASAIHPCEKKVVFSGYPGYGKRGGSVGIYDPSRCELSFLPPEQLLPEQSTVSLAFDASGNMIGSTSVRTPGGAAELAESASLYKLNWKAKKLERVTVPFRYEKEITHICILGNSGLGMTQSSILFQFDCTSLAAAKVKDCFPFGQPVRGGCIQQGREVFFLLEDAVVKADISSAAACYRRMSEKITSGGAIIENNLYFCSGNTLLSMDLNGGESSWAPY